MSLDTTAGIFEYIMPQIMTGSFNGIFFIVANPPCDIITIRYRNCQDYLTIAS
ncbi:hypothetical protein [Sodalis-like endosymbiont of Proechinophthirus fluctus]|uniref:hypothetical protein n=1 Tax=Sodalis-like endosymbiont of Proechinophthirus fluctus TaxID=1462730 RepID=UPI000B25B938|nr:hypothetical protein [Sodalis-like endosymbiont of Proechinophthirus fluctus]